MTVLRYRTAFLTKDQAMDVAELIAHIVTQLVHCTNWTGLDLCPPSCLKWLSQRQSLPDRRDACVHDLILQQCQARPDAQAVCAWDGEMTYGHLDSLSSRLANHLILHGVGPETFVALYFEKSQWVVIALLAVMRAGGAFVLLEPSFPTARLQEMCRQLKVELVLSATHLTTSAVSIAPRVIPVGVQSDCFQYLQPDIPVTLPPKVEPHHALYAVFTSGSTGSPKGVVITHSSYCSQQKALADSLRVDSSCRVLQFSSYAFDVSILDILNPLVTGGCICVPSESSRRSDLINTIIELRANYLHLTPAVSRLLRPTDIPLVKSVLIGGEPMLTSDIVPWASQGVRVLNAYGPAECCIVTTTHVMNDEQDPRVFGSDNCPFCWIVNPSDHNKLVPVGAIGELLIDGPIVGREYVADPVKTASSFVASPRWRQSFLGASPDVKLYKTGDLVQYVANGKIRYVGRKDAQVKLNGQRLELSEVEHHVHNVLGGDSQVMAEMVTPANSEGLSILAAFILPAKCSKETSRDLFAPPSEGFRRLVQTALAQLQDRLPQYMVPSVMVPLIYMPMTSSGKMDRRQVRQVASQLTRNQLEAFNREAAVQYRPPVSAMEIVLHRLIEEVLNVKTFGMNDNFFSLGGDSIRAMKLAQMARQEAGIDLPGINVFETPVLADLALTITPNRGSAADIPPFSLLGDERELSTMLAHVHKECGLPSTVEIEDAYPCTPLQEGMIALSISSPQIKYAAQSVFQVPRAIDTNRLKMAWDTTIRRSPVLRTRIIQNNTGQAFQVVVRGDILWEHADNLEAYIDRNTRRGFRLGEPLMRLALVETDSSRYLVFTIIMLCMMGGHCRKYTHRSKAPTMARYSNQNH